MLDRTDDSSVAADNWLAQFEEALGKSDAALLKTLFHPDSYWRDVLALSWNIQTLNGRDAILKALPPLARSVEPSGFASASSNCASQLSAATELSSVLSSMGVSHHMPSVAAFP